MITNLLDRAQTFGAKLRLSVESLNRDEPRGVYQVREAAYAVLERYYANEVYDRADSGVTAIRVWQGLPKSIRPISMIPKRAVDWWPGSVYPGSWTSDGLAASNGRNNRIPYDVDTPDELREGVQQAFSWANGSRLLSRMVHLGAKLGDVFCEIEVHWSDEGPEHHKVYPVVLHPKHVVKLDLNARGDVKSYRLAVPQWDRITRQPYLWGKEVTAKRITFYKDDEPFSYTEGQPAEVPNEWGFVPAAWIPHMAVGGAHGASAIDGLIPTLDEYQGVLASVDDYIHKFVRQGAIIETNDPNGLKKFLQGQTSSSDASTIQEQINQQQKDKQQINIMPAPEGTRVHHLMQNLGLADAEGHISRLVREIEDAVPEIVFAERLQAMDQVTRPGAMALVSRVQQKLDDVCANYDGGVIKLGQMCCAMAGTLASSGDWGSRSSLTPAQEKFLPFSLESYAKGELDFSLIPRELIPKTTLELAQEAAAIESLRTPTGLRHIGYSDEEIYGLGEDAIPEERPGILEGTGALAAETAGNALATAFNAGILA